MLVEELKAAGLEDAELDDNGYVMATLPGDRDGDTPVVGLIAHVDTSPDAPGDGVEPIVHRAYAGGPIELPRNDTVLDPAAMPELAGKEGHDIVTSSGDTLLGADDKAGVAEIMAAVAHLAAHPELPRPTLRDRLHARRGDRPGRVALRRRALRRPRAPTRWTARPWASCRTRRSPAPRRSSRSTASTSTRASRPASSSTPRGSPAALLAALPADLTPEATSGREGFIHVYEVSATAGQGGHPRDRARLRRRPARSVTSRCCARPPRRSSASEPRARLEIDVRRQYPNMRSHLEPFPEIVEAAERAIRAEGIEPLRTPIRGGTDGSMLSAMGLPTPNLFTGGHEYHSVREWASVQDMAAAAATIVRLAEVWARR